MKSTFNIGELARRTQCQPETIRYYEREALIPEATRTAGNYRVYGGAHVERLAFIRNCRALDMTLDEIRQLLRFVTCRAPPFTPRTRCWMSMSRMWRRASANSETPAPVASAAPPVRGRACGR